MPRGTIWAIYDNVPLLRAFSEPLNIAKLTPAEEVKQQQCGLKENFEVDC
jgi:hypothetical protein